MTLDGNSETFVMYVADLNVSTAMLILPFRASQVQNNPTLTTLQWDKTPTKIPAEYSNYVDIILINLAIELPKNTSMNEHIIELIKEKQPLYGLIYVLSPVKLETLKIYIKTYLKTSFIWPSKSPARAPIFFDKKPDGSFCLYVNYQGLNNLIIKNWYPLSLIGKSLDQLNQIKWFT